jgi:hypothetical protein
MPFAGFVLLTTGYAWFFAWVRQVSGKRTWAGLMSHGWANAFVPLFPTVVMVAGAAQPRYWIWVSLTFVIGLITIALSEARLQRRIRRLVAFFRQVPHLSVTPAVRRLDKVVNDRQ